MKNIVITGAGRGIGFELARKLSKNHHVLALSRNLQNLKTIQPDFPGLKIELFDLNSPTLKSDFDWACRKQFEHIDILINNAGLLVNKPVLEISRKEMEDVYSTNVFGLIETCQSAIPFMSGGSHIVNIGSMGGFQGSAKFPGLSVYSSSKSAVAGFSECLAEELKDQKIAVNCLALGAAQTEMLGEAFPGYKAPLSSEEMASFIADFALQANQYINGKVIPVSISTP